MVTVNSDGAVTIKFNDDPTQPISSSSESQPDNLCDVGIGSRWLRQSAEKRGNLVVVLNAAETHDR